MRNRLMIAAVLVVVVVAGVHARSAAQTDLPFRFGQYEQTVTELNDPVSVAIDEDGAIYIADATNHRIVITDRAGTVRKSSGSYGHGEGQLCSPSGVAVHDGAVYVADTGNHRITVFDSDGSVSRTWGTRGTGPGQFNRPTGIAISSDRIMVADTGNSRVQVFDLEGKALLQFGSFGTADKQFRRPSDVAADEHGNMYVADTDNNRIQKFDSQGNWLRTWGDWGPFIGLMDEPSAVTARDGRVFVTETRNHRVQVFTPDGEHVYQWGVHAILPRAGEGKLHYPNDLAIAPDGSFAVIAEGFENRCQVIGVAADDVTEEQSASPWQAKPQLTHFGRHFDIDENMLVIGEPETHTVYVLRAEGEIPVAITKFGMRGTKFGQFIETAGVSMNAENMQVLVVDKALYRLYRFALDYDRTERLRFVPFVSRMMQSYDLLQVDQPDGGGPALTWPIRPDQIVQDAEGNIYLVDQANSMVHVFDSDVHLVRSLGAAESGGAETGLRFPTDVAIDDDSGRVYIVDAERRVVQIYDEHGKAAGTLGDAETFIRPWGIELLRDGSIVVSDAGSNEILRFDQRGELIERWGGPGYQDGEFWKPATITQMKDGRIFIADYGNHRGQIFDENGQWLVTFGLGRASTRERPRKY